MLVEVIYASWVSVVFGEKKYVSFPGSGVPFIPLSEAKIGMRLSMLPRPVGRCIPIHDVGVTIPIIPLYCFSYAILAHSYQKSPFSYREVLALTSNPGW
jgi:hypothetical protein